MLILSRRVGQKIIIQAGAEKIVVSVIKRDNGKIVMSFEADKSVMIDREEVYIERSSHEKRK